MVCTMKHTWSVQQNIPSSAQCMHLWLPAKQNTPGLYNKTYLVCTVAASGCQYNNTPGLYSGYQYNNIPGLYSGYQYNNIPGLYSGCQYNNKTYLVCTVATSTTTKHTWSVQSVHLWLSKQNPRDTAVRHDWVLWADDVLVFHFTRFAASQRQWQCNDSDLG